MRYSGAQLAQRSSSARHAAARAFRPATGRTLRSVTASASTTQQVPTTSFASDPTYKFAAVLNVSAWDGLLGNMLSNNVR